MGLKFLQDIANLDNIQFINSSGTNAGLINMDGNDLVISNSQGDVLLGDGSADVFIGDGTNNVDIRFEQSGSITADNSNATLTIGGTGNLVVEEPTINNPTFSGSLNVGAKLTFSTSNGYINFDYEPSGETGEYSTPTKLLTVSNGSQEEVIMQRLSQSGALMIGHDDIVAIAAGDTWSILRDNIGWTGENVILASEAGFTSYAFPNNDTAWSNRNTFRFYGGDATAANNGLYIGDGSNTQFIDLNRNLKNIGTIGSGAITSTGKIQGTELEGTSLDINGAGDISGNLTVGGGSNFNSGVNFNGTNDNSTYFAQGNYVEFSNDYLSRNQGNEFLYADRWATTNITGTFSYGSTSVFRPGDNFAAFVSSTGTDNPVSWEVLTSVTATTNVSARRVAIFAHSGFSCDLRIQIKKADSTYADIYNDSYTFTGSRWHLFALTGITYPGDWNILGVKVTIDDYGTSTRYIGQIGITNTRNHNTTPYIFRGGGNLYDNSTLSFGNGNDLQIYHDGSNSYISDNGTGVLYIRSGGNTSATFNGTNVTFAGNVSVNGTVDGVDIGANYSNWNTAYGWGDHSSAGYSTATGVENNADVTDTANVTAAGALMDSEVTNLAQVKAFDSSDYATAAQGTKADNALPKAGGTMTGQLVVNQNAGTLNLVGTDHTYIQWYPAGTSGGRHAYTGFAGSGTDHFTIANETSGAQINLTTNSGTVYVTGDLGVSGTVDGRDVATDGAKLDTIATNADVTPSWVPSSDPSYLTAHPNISAASSVNNSGKTYIQDITLDSNGHVTGLVSDSLTSSDFIEPGSNGALNSLSCGSYTHDTDIAFVLDSDNNETASFIIKDGAGNSPFTLTEAGDLTITGKFISTFASKATAGAILVEDSGEIKKRTTTELKSDLSLNNVPNTDATNASNLSSGTVPTARLATTAIAKGGTGATTASAARAALGVDAAGTDNSTDVTLAGSLNYITISGQEITRNAIDLAADVTGTLPQTNLPDDMDSDKVKQICTTHHNFFMNSSSTTADFFVPFNNLNESSNPTNAQYYNRTVVPYGGRLVKIALHTTAAIGSACKVQFWKTNSTGTFASYTEEVTGIDLNTANSSDTATFSSATFSEGDVVGVSIIKSSSATANMQVTLVWEYTL